MSLNSNDSMNWEIVFTSSVQGFAQTEEKMLALLDVVDRLEQAGALSEAQANRFGQEIVKTGEAAMTATSGLKEYLRTKEQILATDKYQQLGPAIDEELALQKKALRDFSQQLRITMEEDQKLLTEHEKYLAFETRQYNELLYEQEQYDAKKVAAEEKATQEIIAAQEKYLAFETSQYNQLLYEQSVYDARKVASEEKAAEAMIAAHESYVAFETSQYNQLLFEQDRYEAKQVAAAQKAAEEKIAAEEAYVAFETRQYNQLLYEQKKYEEEVLLSQQRMTDKTTLTTQSMRYAAAGTLERAAAPLAQVLTPISTEGLTKEQTAVAIKANQELAALQQRLTLATEKTQTAVRQLTLSYQLQETAAIRAGKPNTSEQTALATQKVKQEVDGVTKAYAAETKEIEAAAKATRDYAASATGATGAVRGMGNFYPLILQTAFWAKASKDLLAFGGAAIKTSKDYQDAFASVSRTASITGSNVSGQLEYIRQALMKLDTQVPASFKDLSSIATMGNEMGITADQIVGFTKTVEQYATITGTSVQDTANSLGAIGNILKLPADGYQKLGSAISLTGRLSLASEPEIVTMTERIAATAHQAGLTTQQIIGLSATLSSLKEAPERSQGALEKYFQVVNVAASEGGPKLDAFAKAIGKSTAATKDMIQNNPMEFFKEFLGYISKLGSGDQFKALKDFGLSNLRVSEVIRRLSGDIPLLNRLVGDSNKGYAEGSDLSKQFAQRTATLAQQFIELQNAVANLFADIGSAGVLQSLTPVVTFLTAIVNTMSDFIQQHTGIASIIIAFSLLGGAIAAVRAAYFGAALMATVFTAAETRLEGTSIISTLGTISHALLGVDVAGWAAATGLERAAIAVRGLVSATIIGAVLQYLISMMNDFRGTMLWTADAMAAVEPVVGEMVFIFDELGAAVASLAFVVVKAAAIAASGFGLISDASTKAANATADWLYSTANNLGSTAANNQKILDQQLAGFKKWATALKDLNKAPNIQAPNVSIDSLAMADYQKRVAAADKAQQGLGTSADNAASSVDNLAAQVYTLADYGNDLSSVFKRAFDIQFGPSQAFDAITTQFQSMRDAATQAKKDVQSALDAIRQTEADISKTNADNVQQKYFLSVANQFGDANRAGAIQATIDGNNSTLADDKTKLLQSQADLATATDKLSTSFDGNTAGAIANRGALSALYQKYQDYITALASSGADQKTLSKAVADAKANFDKQASSLGFSKKAIDQVNSGFDGMISIIGKVPRNITVSANANPAMTAINEFVAKATSKLSSLSKPINIPAPKFGNPDTAAAIKSSITTEIALDTAALQAYQRFIANSPSLGDTTTVKDYESRLAVLRQELASYAFAEGGYTGPGGKYQPAGVVHKGEYVVPAYMVNQSTGLPYADALGRLVSGAPAQSSYASGGYVNGDMMVTELGPRSLGVLRQMVNSEVVAVISAQNVTGAVNSTNAANRRRGR